MPMDRMADMEEKLRILEDLNMIYIRQIALSLKDSDIQKKIDHEIRMRDGACKLLAACSQRDQALEASKSLLTCNTRIMAYMSELQRMKEAQVMQRVARRSSDAGPMDDRHPCKAKVAISDLRIPLMWKDTEYFKNKGELHRCAVFCLLQLGGQSFDTDMVMVDRTLTDICFENTIVFEEVSPGFELRVELYSSSWEDGGSAGSTPRKLASKLSSSLGRSAGKRMRAAMEPGGNSPTSHGGGTTLLLPVPSVPGPKYHLLAHTTLTLTHVQDSFRTHDLSITANEECSFWLPLYGSVCCRLAAQPHCMTQQMMSGQLRVKLGGDPQGWTDIYGVLKGTKLFCYHKQDDKEASVDPAVTIGINKETRIRAAEKDPHSKAQSICISNQYGGEEVTHTLSTDSREDTQRWMEAFWQQFYDMSQWKQCCDDLMKIDLPSPRKPALISPKQGSLYHEMVIDTSDDISTVTDILTRRMHDSDLRSRLEQATPTPVWLSLFEEDCSPPTTPIPSHYQKPPVPRPCSSPRSPARASPRCGGRLSSLASLTSESDSPCSTSPCSRHGWTPEPPAAPPSFRPRTLSLDAKLSSLRVRGYSAGLQCACQTPAAVTSGSPHRAPALAGLSCSSTSSTSSSSSEGSGGPDSDLPFSRPGAAGRSARNLRSKLDPRNWLQSQV
ncbi:rhotekin isoform X2 [Denticeps clupeoides]|uniref:Rhotekin n=1 Tax=Denticeps clupeoides TaxID=299321 RepID=A0AAY4C3B0_9TELE|nr:rhotekin isoform X2 [Denticeps clupeoides]XP_028850919.1 rhotekin isoform X2 [Denticeps clupeoides]XP_028850921.1 rhotekin isoform X2 [Denticeps clupeoides]